MDVIDVNIKEQITKIRDFFLKYYDELLSIDVCRNWWSSYLTLRNQSQVISRSATGNFLSGKR